MTDDDDHGPDGTGNGKVDPRLAEVFGGRVPRGELEAWASMPPARREMALRRMAALDRYVFGDDKPTARTAASAAGVRLPRFYQMARAWGVSRSLASVGAYVEAPRSRERFDAAVVNALQSAVVGVVDVDPRASVAAQARLLADACASLGASLPRHGTLRTFVERERARREQEELAGTEVLFDCALSSIPVGGEVLFTVFLAIDRATGLILGAGVGDAGDSAAGYRAAAADALARLRGPLADAAIWSPRMIRSQLVPGEDVEAIGRLIGLARAAVGGAAPQRLAAGRYGAYARRRLGLKIGPVQLLPARTGTRVVPTVAAMAEAVGYARDRLAVEVAAHDDRVMSGPVRSGSGVPPGNLVALLGAMASSPPFRTGD